MRYTVITAGNFADIENTREAAKARINAAYKLNCFDNYAHGTFAVLGADAVQMFRDKYGFKLDKEAAAFKTDGKTRAKLVPFITPSYYYDARDGHEGITDIYPHTAVNYLVEFDGVLLDCYAYQRGDNTRVFYLFNDSTDYRTYLPYNWEEKHPAPNKVGTLTDKKVAAWVEWLQAKKAAAEAENARRTDGVAAFLEDVAKIDTSKCKEFRIGKDRGYFVRNGLRYSYTISDGGHISQDIKVDTYGVEGSAIDKFNKMVEGKL